MRSSNNLKEIYFGKDRFCFNNLSVSKEMMDLNNHPNKFLFYNCCKVLERVSIQKAALDVGCDTDCTQNSIVKFVQNAPHTLKWFGSDLTPENIEMLRSERLDIKQLN